MKFNEWWDMRVGGSLRPETSYRYRDVKQWAALAWIDAFQEGFRLGKAASEPPNQGGGSQEPAKAPVAPCQGGCPTICPGCPRA